MKQHPSLSLRLLRVEKEGRVQSLWEQDMAPMGSTLSLLEAAMVQFCITLAMLWCLVARSNTSLNVVVKVFFRSNEPLQSADFRLKRLPSIMEVDLIQSVETLKNKK